jgi:hypothetical protein
VRERGAHLGPVEELAQGGLGTAGEGDLPAHSGARAGERTGEQRDQEHLGRHELELMYEGQPQQLVGRKEDTRRYLPLEAGQ